MKIGLIRGTGPQTLPRWALAPWLSSQTLRKGPETPCRVPTACPWQPSDSKLIPSELVRFSFPWLPFPPLSSGTHEPLLVCDCCHTAVSPLLVEPPCAL